MKKKKQGQGLALFLFVTQSSFTMNDGWLHTLRKHPIRAQTQIRCVVFEYAWPGMSRSTFACFGLACHGFATTTIAVAIAIATTIIAVATVINITTSAFNDVVIVTTTTTTSCIRNAWKHGLKACSLQVNVEIDVLRFVHDIDNSNGVLALAGKQDRS